MILVVILFLVLPIIAGAQGTGASNPGGTSMSNPITLDNPLGDVNTLYDFVVLVLNDVVLPIGSVVVVLFIIYTGFLFVTARGNPEKIESAKRTLLWVVIGTAILLGSVVISEVIDNTLHQIAPSLPR